jgi:hypothetical protein
LNPSWNFLPIPILSSVDITERAPIEAVAVPSKGLSIAWLSGGAVYRSLKVGEPAEKVCDAQNCDIAFNPSGAYLAVLFKGDSNRSGKLVVFDEARRSITQTSTPKYYESVARSVRWSSERQ